MGQRGISFLQDEFYHVYNRGTDKRIIFCNNDDYFRFIELLYLSNSQHRINVRDIEESVSSIYEFNREQTLVSIGAYCLMPNHFHILLTPEAEGGVADFMRKLGTSYSMYFNKKYGRTGTLFEGKFKAKHADADEYLKYLFAYIHLNPVKLIDPTWKEKGIADAVKAYEYAASYEYSSLPDYLGRYRKQVKIINQAPFPKYFSDHQDIKKELFEWLTFENHPKARPSKALPLVE